MFDNIQHVYPVNDEREHDLTVNYRPIGLPYCACECRPEHKELENGAMVIVHNSWDGREGVEWANEILEQ